LDKQVEGGYENSDSNLNGGLDSNLNVTSLRGAMWGMGETSPMVNKLILGCDFIECIYMYEAFIKNLHRNDIEYWCYKNQMDYKNMLGVVAKRDEIIETLASCNFKFNYDAPRLTHNIDDKNLNYIQCIKRCIRTGYKNHTATWDPDRNNYIDDNKKIVVKVTSGLTKFKPNHIVYPRKAFKFEKNNKQYELRANMISALPY
jgi:hypothetical protein